jgi:hypothetical protein
MSFAAVAIGGAAVIGAGASIYGASQQAGASKDAQKAAWAQYADTTKRLDPYAQSGQAALAQLNTRLGITGSPNTAGYGSLVQPFSLADFQQSPNYQFNLQQGQQAIDKAAAARGNYYAPQTLQDTARFSQGLASNEFNNAYQMYNQNQSNMYNRLYAQVGVGENASAGLGGFGANAASQIGLAGMQGGAAQAAGIQGAGMSLSQLAYLPQILSQNQGSVYGGGPAVTGGLGGYDIPSTYTAGGIPMGGFG